MNPDCLYEVLAEGGGEQRLVELPHEPLEHVGHIVLAVVLPADLHCPRIRPARGDQGYRYLYDLIA